MLHGERVTLRGVTRDDLPRLTAFDNDVDVEVAAGGSPPMPRSLERAQADFDREAAKGGRDSASFVIEVDGLVVGRCDLRPIEGAHGTRELGITIGDKAYWSQRIGRECVTLLLDYAFRLLNTRKVWLRVWANNERGIRCYRACGFVEEGRLRQHVWSNGGYVDLVYMGVLREEWSARELTPPSVPLDPSLVPCQATFARLTRSRSARSCAWRLRQWM